MILRVQRKASGAPADSFFTALGRRTLCCVRGVAFARRAEVSLVICGDGAIQRLNRRWRRKDRPTDVLSFPLLEGPLLAQPKGQPLALGDVVISVPTARRQAAAAGKTLKTELALLWVHGLLHLLGYDHVMKSGEKRMFALQTRILKTDS